MTREIKFRAWHKINKSMSPVALDLLGVAMQGQFSEQNKFSVKKLLELFIWLQYTGLKDKNGKEIYEGDIIQFKSRGTGKKFGELQDFIIEWDEYVAGWAAVDRTNNIKYKGGVIDDGVQIDLVPENLERMHIIGNIYENPGLLLK